MTALFAQWQPWVEALGWALLHFIWQGVVIGAAYALFRRLVPKQSCDLRYLLGLLALTLLAICPLVTLWLLRPQPALMATPTLDVVAGIGSRPRLDGVALATSDLSQYLPWLVLAWVVGALAMAVRALRQWRSLDRVACRLARRHCDLDRMLGHLASRFGLTRVRVLISNHIDTPTLIGWIKPAILLPASVALGFPRQQVELILAHELGHLRRYDHLVNLVQAVLETLLYYHPVVHWISRDVRNEREICCDQLVLRVTRGEPREYARTLAALEEFRHTGSRLAVAATGGVLIERVRRIVGMPTPGLAPGRSNVALWLVIAATAFITLATALQIQERETDAGVTISAVLDRLPRPDIRILLNFGLKLPPTVGAPQALSPPRLTLPAVKSKRSVATRGKMVASLSRWVDSPVEVLSTLARPHAMLADALRDSLKPATGALDIARLEIPLSEPPSSVPATPAVAERTGGGDSENANCIRRTGSLLCRHLPDEPTANMTIIHGGGNMEGGSHRIGP
ncbi:MAG: M56 family metallopeptidase [Rhodanobacteraceae bacterium]